MQLLEYAKYPEEAGISSSGILNYLAAREAAGLEHHAIWVLRHGKVAARLNYAPYDDHTPHMLFSLSKSFCSAAAGFAVQEGLLNWDTRVIDVLPEAFPERPSEWLQAITLHHLLTMGSGLKPESDDVYGENWPRLILAWDCDHEPGTHFHYNSHGTYLVSAMVQKVTGMTVRDYLVPRLFEPLGMMNADGTAPKWECCPAGINVGGWGLWLSCAQIAPFGQCLLQKGIWDGKQVLPRAWLDRATVFQIDNGNGEHLHDHDWNMGYGYQFWMCKGEKHDGFTPRYRGDGAMGQYCIVDEKRDMVVCAVSGLNDMGKALDLFYDHLFAAADMAPADGAVQAELRQKLAALAYPWPAHDGSALPAGVYADENGSPVLTIEPDRVTISLNEQQTALFFLDRAETAGGVMSCCGMQEGRLHMLARILNEPFMLDATCTFCDGRAELSIRGVGMDEKTLSLQKK